METNMITRRYAVDRIEGRLAVLVADERGVADLHLDASEHGLCVNDIADCDFEGDRLVSLRKNPEERERRLASNRSRLRALFNKKKPQ